MSWSIQSVRAWGCYTWYMATPNCFCYDQSLSILRAFGILTQLSHSRSIKSVSQRIYNLAVSLTKLNKFLKKRNSLTVNLIFLWDTGFTKRVLLKEHRKIGGGLKRKRPACVSKIEVTEKMKKLLMLSDALFYARKKRAGAKNVLELNRHLIEKW